MFEMPVDIARREDDPLQRPDIDGARMIEQVAVDTTGMFRESAQGHQNLEERGKRKHPIQQELRSDVEVSDHSGKGGNESKEQHALGRKPWLRCEEDREDAEFARAANGLEDAEA